jgi:hypothetical protein
MVTLLVKWLPEECSMKRYRRRQRETDLITATELASFAYCPEQWRLQYGQGLLPANGAVMHAGTRHHEQTAVAEQIAGGSIELGRFVAVLAAVVLLVLLWWWL